MSDAYRKLRFTLRFLLGNLHDFDPEKHAVPFASLPATDRYALHRLATVVDDAGAAYEEYAFSRAHQGLVRFCATDLSTWYLDAAKDRLYVRGAGSDDRRACQTVLAAVLTRLVGALAPITPHLAEDAWQAVPWAASRGAAWPASVFLAGWAAPEDDWRSLPSTEVTAMEAALEVRAEVNQALEAARRDGVLGAGLDAAVAVHVADPTMAASLASMQAAPNGADPLRYNFIVSDVALVPTEGEATAGTAYSRTTELPTAGRVVVGVRRAGGGKCGRCWCYSPAVGADSAHPALCERCVPVVLELGIQAAPAPAAAPAGAVQ